METKASKWLNCLHVILSRACRAFTAALGVMLQHLQRLQKQEATHAAGKLLMTMGMNGQDPVAYE